MPACVGVLPGQHGSPFQCLGLKVGFCDLCYTALPTRWQKPNTRPTCEGVPTVVIRDGKGNPRAPRVKVVSSVGNHDAGFIYTCPTHEGGVHSPKSRYWFYLHVPHVQGKKRVCPKLGTPPWNAPHMQEGVPFRSPPLIFKT